MSPEQLAEALKKLLRRRRAQLTRKGGPGRKPRQPHRMDEIEDYPGDAFPSDRSKADDREVDQTH